MYASFDYVVYGRAGCDRHSATPDSSATLDVVESLDKVLNHFFTEARQLDIFDKIDFIVLSDHGMATYYPEKYVNLNDIFPGIVSIMFLMAFLHYYIQRKLCG